MNSKKIYNKLQQRMPDFQNAKVYKLVNTVDDKIYVGSTCKTLEVRMSGHKSDAKRSPNSPVYVHLNKIGWDKVDIALIEKYPCNTKEELKYRERYYIELLKPELNTLRPIINEDERILEAIDYAKLYRQNNKELIKENLKKYYRNTKERDLEKRREYRQKNAEKIKEWHKKNYRDNAEKIKKRKQETRKTVNCICGGSYENVTNKKEKHLNTIKHNKYVKSNIHTLFWDKRNEILM